MQIARVVGDVVSTMKDAALVGHKLLILQPVTPDRQPSGRVLVAADAVGAGVGEHVFFVRGREATYPVLSRRTAGRRVCGWNRGPAGIFRKP